MAFRIVRDAKAPAARTDCHVESVFKMSTPTLCATVDLIFSQSSSCLGGMTPGCPFRPLGEERGGEPAGQSFQIGALTTL